MCSVLDVGCDVGDPGIQAHFNVVLIRSRRLVIQELNIILHESLS